MEVTLASRGFPGTNGAHLDDLLFRIDDSIGSKLFFFFLESTEIKKRRDPNAGGQYPSIDAIPAYAG